jgi:hypothetical protein
MTGNETAAAPLDHAEVAAAIRAATEEVFATMLGI